MLPENLDRSIYPKLLAFIFEPPEANVLAARESSLVLVNACCTIRIHMAQKRPEEAVKVSTDSLARNPGVKLSLLSK